MADQEISAKHYAHPDALVSTQWLADHLGDANVRILESDEDVLLYDSGHIPGALKIDWHSDLNDQLQRDYVSREEFQALVRRLGIDTSTTVVLYGDKNNWWATYALWVFQLFGVRNVKILDGGRAKWEAEGREMSTDVPSVEPSSFVAPERDDASIRAFMSDVRDHVNAHGKLIDVRSPDEYSGKKLHMPDYPQEGAMRGGHIPNAKSVPWARAANADGTFKSAEELRAIYEGEAGLDAKDDVVAYCRIGERSSHTWFVLSYLLGYEKVRNYDGSWTEWGNAVRAPIEK
ncbi:MAG: Rhodanese-like protein [Gemmatimonadetes bacterium]|nr:Rhodanese-like protein [Gemmatimonadota bacterium]